MGITLKNNKSVIKNMTIKGDDGIGIKTITSGTPVVTEEKTTTPITVTLTDETTQNFNVEAKNGSGANNALTKPTTTPSATQIVAVDNTNTQTMLNIGDGLSVENGSLKASAGGGNKLYLHNIKFTQPNSSGFEAVTNVITKNSDLFTIQSLYEYLINNGFIDNGLNVNGIFGDSTSEFVVLTQLKGRVNQNLYMFYGIGIQLNNGIFTYQVGRGRAFNVDINDINLVDTVIEL